MKLVERPAGRPDAAKFILLKACCLLLFLGYASGAGEECPFVAPLSSYSPSISSGGLSPVTPQVAAQLDSIISSFISDNGVSLYAASVVYADQMVYTSGLATSPFMIASVTKTFTALGALMLRERGLLSLDDPVKKFIPNFKIVNPYEPHDTTLRELMGHVSGLPRELCADNYALAHGLSEDECPVEEADVLKSMARMQLVRPPWSREPAYSNLAFGLLGHSWEKATSPQKAWDEFIVEDILMPLGMNSTGLDLRNITLVDNQLAADLDYGWVAPAINMYSTATDLAKYLIFLLKAQPGLISAATIREWTNTRTIFPDGNGGFALPWELSTINATGREFLISKSGRVQHFRSIITIHPPTQLGISFLFRCNDSGCLQGPEGLMGDVLNYLIPLVEKETAEIIDPLYTGHYVCIASPPVFNEFYNATIEIVGGFIDIADSPSLGLSAFSNVSVILAGQPKHIQTAGMLGMLLKNSTENSFWLGSASSCTGYFEGISSQPSFPDPNYPGAPYKDEIEFDFAQKTVSWLGLSAVCLKTET